MRKCIFSTYRSWVIVNFLLSTGVRQNSLINVKIRDVDFDNSVVYVNMTKNRKPLIIPLNEDILRILKEYLQYRGGEADDWLFCSVYGRWHIALIKDRLFFSQPHNGQSVGQ